MSNKVAQIGIGVLAIGAFTLAGCGSKDDAKSTTTTTSTTSATKTTMMENDEASTTTTSESAAASSPVGGVQLGDGQAPASRTITVSASGMNPDTLTIKVGENVTFKDAASNVYGVVVGDLDQYTVYGGMYETFDFSKPGTYPVSEVLTENTAKIIVE